MTDRDKAIEAMEQVLTDMKYAEPISVDGMSLEIHDDLVDEHGRFNELAFHYAGWVETDDCE